MDPSGDTSFNYPDTFGSSPTSGASTWDSVINAVRPNQQTSDALGTAQIASPYQNALNANAAAIAAGLPPPYTPAVLAAMQGAIAQQTSQFKTENAALFAVSPLDPTTWPWYYWLGVGGVSLLLLAKAFK